jgi:hypothetical protein
LIPNVLDRRIDELCRRYDTTPPIIRRVALTEDLIAAHNLPSRPTKRDGNTHARAFEGESTLDALPASVPRDLLRNLY